MLCPACGHNPLVTLTDAQTNRCSACRSSHPRTDDAKRCRVCSRRTDVGVRGVCASCLEELGVPETLSTDARLRGACSACAGTRILLVELSQGVTYPIAFIQGEHTERRPYRATDRPIGRFTARICLTCGRADLHVQEPEKIPIGVEYATEIVEVEASPYR